jgi:DNA-binding Lrp family transcriptional regulator
MALSTIAREAHDILREVQGNRPKFRISYGKLSRRLGVTHRAAARAVGKLREAGLINVTSVVLNADANYRAHYATLVEAGR